VFRPSFTPCILSIRSISETANLVDRIKAVRLSERVVSPNNSRLALPVIAPAAYYFCDALKLARESAFDIPCLMGQRPTASVNSWQLYPMAGQLPTASHV
jgi:hypothetical protein